MDEVKERPLYMGIRAISNAGIFPEAALRKMEKAGQLPCIYSGKKCLVNVEKLITQLSAMSDSQVHL